MRLRDVRAATMRDIAEHVISAIPNCVFLRGFLLTAVWNSERYLPRQEPASIVEMTSVQSPVVPIAAQVVCALLGIIGMS
jgi:hypothetical protein